MKLHSACFEKLISEHVFNVKKPRGLLSLVAENLGAAKI